MYHTFPAGSLWAALGAADWLRLEAGHALLCARCAGPVATPERSSELASAGPQLGANRAGLHVFISVVAAADLVGDRPLVLGTLHVQRTRTSADRQV